MYHRFCKDNGLGNPEPCKLDNNITIDKDKWSAFCNDFCAKYKLIDDWGGFDFHYEESAFLVGIEPTYMNDELLIIKFDLDDKNKSSITMGVALGEYGTRCDFKTYLYADCEQNSTFTDFIDRWYDFVKDNLRGEKK